MNRADFYPRSLPAEFAPPDVAAMAIAALPTRAEREAYWLRVPEAWRKAIGHLATLFIGQQIAALPDIAARRIALAEVPEIWLEEVKWHTRRLYATREVRAEYEAEQAAARANAIKVGKW